MKRAFVTLDLTNDERQFLRYVLDDPDKSQLTIARQLNINKNVENRIQEIASNARSKVVYQLGLKVSPIRFTSLDAAKKAHKAGLI